MKPTTLLFIAAAFVICCSTCKKESSGNNTDVSTTFLPCDSNKNTFTITLENYSGANWRVLEDRERNILLLNTTHMIKYDHKGKLLWQKPVAVKQGIQSLIQADGSNYFVVSANLKFEGTFYPMDILSNTDLSLNNYMKYDGQIMQDCYPEYKNIHKPMESPDVYHAKPFPINQSTSYLQKFSRNGELLWEKTFEGNYVGGNTIIPSADGNFFLLTYKSSGFIQEALFDANNVFQDTIRCKEDKNELYLNKIDGDGQVLWSKKYEAIRERHNDLLDFRCSVVEAGNNIVILARHQVLILDKNGNELERKKPDENCRYQGVCAVAQGNTVYVAATNPWDAKYLVIRRDLSWTQQTSDLDVAEDGTIDYHYALTNDAQYIGGARKLARYDLEGNLQWRKDVEMLVAITPTCKGGLIYVRSVNGINTLTKTDERGN